MRIGEPFSSVWIGGGGLVDDVSGCPRLSTPATVAVVAVVVTIGLLLGRLLVGRLRLGRLHPGRPRRVTVQGDSMRPLLRPGDRLLVVPTGRWRPGEVVALRDPRDPGRLLVKRVLGVEGPDGPLTVIGDNPLASTDSRQFGPVDRRSVVGRAVYRYAPRGREGWLRVAGPDPVSGWSGLG